MKISKKQKNRLKKRIIRLMSVKDKTSLKKEENRTTREKKV